MGDIEQSLLYIALLITFQFFCEEILCLNFLADFNKSASAPPSESDD